MTAFATAVNALFSDPHLGADASYDPVAGAVLSVRVVRDVRPARQEFGPFQAAAVAPVYLIEVRAADVAQPAKGDTLTVAGMTFVVRSFEPDSEKLVWRLNVDRTG